MEDLELDVNFMINNPQMKAQANQAKAEILGIANTAEVAGKRISESLSPKLTGKGIIDDLKAKLEEARKVASSAANETTIEIANDKIQQYEKELKRLSVIGRQGFDDLGNAIAEGVEKPIGRLQRLQKLAQIYSNGSATTNNSELLEKYNRKLQETQVLINQTQNVGKVGFDKMGNAIQNNGNIVSKLWAGLYKVANILPGLGVAGLLAFGLDPLIAYLSKLDMFKKKVDEAQLSANGFTKSLEGGGEYAKAVSNVTKLNVTIELARKGLYDQKAVVDLYNESIGKTAGAVKNLDEVEKGMADNAKNYVQMTLYKAAAENVLEEAGRKAAEAAKERNKSDAESVPFILSNTKGLSDGKGGDFYKKAAKNARERAALAIEAESKPLEAIAEDLFKKAGEFADKMGGKLGLDKTKTTKTDATIEAAANLQQRVFEVNEEYARKSKTKDEEELQALRDKFEKIAKEVEKFNRNPKNKVKVDGSGLDVTLGKAIEDLTFRQDTEKLKVSLEKQKGLFAEYEEYKKNFGEKAAKERFAKELDTNKTYLQTVQEEYIKLNSKQAKTLTGAEKERLEFLGKSLETATKDKRKVDDEQYKIALDAAKTYSEKLLEIDKDYNMKVKALKENNGLTTDRLKVLDDERKKAVDSAKDEALQKTAIYKQLAVDTIEMTRTQVKAQIEILKGLLEESDVQLPNELRERLERELGNLEVVMKLGIDQANLEQLKARYKNLVNEIGLVDEFGQSLLSETERKRVIQALTDIKQRIKAIDASGDGKVTWTDKITKAFEYLQGSTEEVAKGLQNDLGRLGSTFGGLANEVGQYNSELANSLNSLSQLVNVGASAAQSVAGFASGDIISGVSGAIGAIGGIITMVSNLNQKYDQFYKNIIEGERKYQEALLARQLLEAQTNPIKYKALASEFNLLTKEVKAYNEEYAKIFNDLQFQSYVDYVVKEKAFWITISNQEIMASLKGKTFEDLKKLLAEDRLRGATKEMVERLVELEQKGYDAQKALNDLAKQMAELFTGTTSDALTDSLLQMFREGKTGVQDLADFFEQTMKDAALSMFKNKVLAEAMEKFYEEFSKSTEGGNLDQSKIANLKLLFDSLVQGANTQFQAIQQITGLNLVNGTATAGNTSTGLTGQIQRSITEATGSELAGLFRSFYDISKKTFSVESEGLSVMRQQANSLMAIEQNTANTVTEVKNAVVELRKIRANSDISYDRGW